MEDKNKSELTDNLISDEELNAVSGGWDMRGTRICQNCGYTEDFECDSSKWNWIVLMETPDMRCPICNVNMFKVKRRF